MRVAVKRTTQQSNKKTRGDGEEDSKEEEKREGDGSILRSLYGLGRRRSILVRFLSIDRRRRWRRRRRLRTEVVGVEPGMDEDGGGGSS